MNALTLLVILIDERKVLSEEQLEYAWTPGYRNVAIVALGPFALLLHFIKTRTRLSLRGVLLGFPYGLTLGLVAVALVVFGGGLLLDAVFSVLGFPDSE